MRISQFVISSDLKFSRNVFAFTRETVSHKAAKIEDLVNDEEPINYPR